MQTILSFKKSLTVAISVAALAFTLNAEAQRGGGGGHGGGGGGGHGGGGGGGVSHGGGGYGGGGGVSRGGGGGSPSRGGGPVVGPYNPNRGNPGGGGNPGRGGMGGNPGNSNPGRGGMGGNPGRGGNGGVQAPRAANRSYQEYNRRGSTYRSYQVYGSRHTYSYYHGYWGGRPYNFYNPYFRHGWYSAYGYSPWPYGFAYEWDCGYWWPGTSCWYPWYGYYWHRRPHYYAPSEFLTDYIAAEYMAEQAEEAQAAPAEDPAYVPLTQAEQDAIYAQQNTQVQAELNARKSDETVAFETKLNPQHLFSVSEALDISPTNGSPACHLSLGDVIRLAPNADTTAEVMTMTVVNAQKGDCHVGVPIPVAVSQLVEFENEYNRHLDQGTEKVQNDPTLSAQFEKSTEQ